MVMGCGPGGTAARQEGLSTPRQLWLIRQQQSQQQILQRVEAVLIRLTRGARSEPTEPWGLGGAGHVRPLQGSIMLRGDVFSTRGVMIPWTWGYVRQFCSPQDR